MNKRFFRGLSSLRFTKWSRKSYAAFKSVGRHVTIGNVKNIVADTLLGKQKTNLSVALSFENENNFYEDGCIDPQPKELQIPIPLPILKSKKINDGCMNAQFVEEYFLWLKAVCYKCFQLFYSLKYGIVFTQLSFFFSIAIGTAPLQLRCPPAVEAEVKKARSFNFGES